MPAAALEPIRRSDWVVEVGKLGSKSRSRIFVRLCAAVEPELLVW